MVKALPALTVDKAGLGRVLARRGIEFAVLELIQNAFDEDVTEVSVAIEHVARGWHSIHIMDDSPNGWEDLDHAHRLFADSYKKNDPSKRGKFNLGEKLVIALAREAWLVTTTGGWHWQGDSRRRLRTRTEAGSRFYCELPMTLAEASETLTVVNRVLVPSQVTLTINNAQVTPRLPIHTFEMTLPTEVADEGNRLVRTRRKTEVRVYDRLHATEPEAWLYELGLPVVELDGGDRWHLDIGQRVPVGMDRDNVSPAYLRKLRGRVLSEMSSHLTSEDSTTLWVDQALEDPNVAPEAVSRVLDGRYGKKRVSYDPSDPEASKRAAGRGYAVIHGGSFNKPQWENIRGTGTAPAAGIVCPTKSPQFGPDGEDVTVPRCEWTNGMVEIVEWSETVSRELLDREVHVGIVSSKQAFGAMYLSGSVHFNVRQLGKKWFHRGITNNVIELVIHELGHEFSSDHLSAKYHEGLCTLAQRLARLAVRRPELFPADSRTWR